MIFWPGQWEDLDMMLLKNQKAVSFRQTELGRQKGIGYQAYARHLVTILLKEQIQICDLDRNKHLLYYNQTL